MAAILQSILLVTHEEETWQNVLRRDYLKNLCDVSQRQFIATEEQVNVLSSAQSLISLISPLVDESVAK